MTTTTRFTTRDHYILAKALAYASEWLGTQDELHDEPSDRMDMDDLLARLTTTKTRAMYRDEARLKLGSITNAEFLRRADERALDADENR